MKTNGCDGWCGNKKFYGIEIKHSLLLLLLILLLLLLLLASKYKIISQTKGISFLPSRYQYSSNNENGRRKKRRKTGQRHSPVYILNAKLNLQHSVNFDA